MYLSVILVNNVLECSLQLTFMFYNVSATLAYFGDYPITNGGSEKNKKSPFRNKLHHQFTQKRLKKAKVKETKH